jgi:ferredoxin
MKVIVESNRCELHGECVMAVPEIFEIEDDKDVVTLINPEPGEHLRSKVEDAVLMCPAAAISLAD